LYPSSSWKPIYEKLSQLNDFDPKVREFRRFFLGSASEVELDTAGRLLIPPTLKEYAGLQKDITLASAVNKLEVWDTTKYKQLIESYSESFSYTAKNVMVDYNVTI
jgi:MraZ protein